MSAVASPVLCRRPAMNTWFEIILLGEDEENLQAAGEAALDEIERIEKLLSRFDPSSDVSRINREASHAPVLIDFELAEILKTCLVANQETKGFFEIAAASEVEFRFESRLISFRNPSVRLDFGAFGKGYALDCAAICLRDFSVKNALLHGGTSSILAIGGGANNEPWRVSLRGGDREIQLCDNALSTSATGQGDSDIVNPLTHQPIQHRATCSVISATAAQAEIFSTALLCMGKEPAASFLEERMLPLEMFWTEDAGPDKSL